MPKTFTTTLLALLLATATHANTTFNVGDTIPETLSLTDHLGKTHTFADFRSKNVVLEWTNPGCPFVRKFYDSGAMQKQQAASTANGVIWLAINSSAKGKEGYIAPETAPVDVAKTEFKGTAYILDAAGTLGKQFGATTTPNMVVADKTGKIVYMGAIDSIPSFSKDDIVKADNYVAQALESLQTGAEIKTPTTKSYGCSVKY